MKYTIDIDITWYFTLGGIGKDVPLSTLKGFEIPTGNWAQFSKQLSCTHFEDKTFQYISNERKTLIPRDVLLAMRFVFFAFRAKAIAEEDAKIHKFLLKSTRTRELWCPQIRRFHEISACFACCPAIAFTYAVASCKDVWTLLIAAHVCFSTGLPMLGLQLSRSLHRRFWKMKVFFYVFFQAFFKGCSMCLCTEHFGVVSYKRERSRCNIPRLKLSLCCQIHEAMLQS